MFIYMPLKNTKTFCDKTNYIIRLFLCMGNFWGVSFWCAYLRQSTHGHRKGKFSKKHKLCNQFRMKEHTSQIKKKLIFEKLNEGFLRNVALKPLLGKKLERLKKLQIFVHIVQWYCWQSLWFNKFGSNIVDLYHLEKISSDLYTKKNDHLFMEIILILNILIKIAKKYLIYYVNTLYAPHYIDQLFFTKRLILNWGCSFHIYFLLMS